MLEERIRLRLQKTRESLIAQRDLISKEALLACYARFRQKFGPEKLSALDGEALLTAMHDHTDRDSLVYWLEFKNDEDLPAIFGSIAGGSALKFGIYRRKETGAWTTGSSVKQVELSVPDAIAVARKHRDQLIAGTKLLDSLPSNGTDEHYQHVQNQMEALAPDVSGLAWGHKYFQLVVSEQA